MTIREQFTTFHPPPVLHSLLYLEEQMAHFRENLLNVDEDTPLWLSDHTVQQGSPWPSVSCPDLNVLL